MGNVTTRARKSVEVDLAMDDEDEPFIEPFFVSQRDHHCEDVDRHPHHHNPSLLVNNVEYKH